MNNNINIITVAMVVVILAGRINAQSDNLIDTSGDLLEWKCIEGFNPDAQKDSIRKYMESKLKEMGENENLDPAKIEKINDKWQGRKDIQNPIYLDSLFAREEELNKNFQHLANKSQEIRLLEARIDSLKEIRKMLRVNIYNADLMLTIYDQWIDRNRDKLKLRLRNLPLRIVLVGRKKFDPNISIESLREQVIESMILGAIQLIIGERIGVLTEYENDEIINHYVVSEIEGNAQIGDQYFKPVIRTDLSDNQRYSYIIARVDVYPFNQEGPSSADSDAAAPQRIIPEDINIYHFGFGESYVYEPEIGWNYGIADLNLPNEVIDYLKKQRGWTETNNNIVNQKITGYRGDFLDNQDNYKTQNDSIESLISGFQQQIVVINQQLSELGQMKFECNIERDRLDSLLQKSEIEYMRWAENEVCLTNRIKSINIENIAVGKTLKDAVIDAVVDSYDEVRNLMKRKKSSRIIEIKGTTDKMQYSMTLTSREFDMRFTHFGILYMGFISDKDEVINCAYKYKYAVVENTIIDMANFSFKLITEKLEWKAKDMFDHSHQDIGEKPSGNGWRLPTITELIDLNNAIKIHSTRKSQNVWEMLHWEPAIYATSNLHSDKYRMDTYDFKTESKVQKTTHSAVKVLWVREIAE